MMFKSCLDNFLDDVVVFVVDFVENYSFEIQNECNPCTGIGTK
jgi:hypothetical protein